MNLSEIKSKRTTEELLEFGIININKPSGPTSFDVSYFIKKSLGLRKTSHLGTLDPKVTGVLPVALNRACKLTGYFLGEDKEYVGIMRVHEKINLRKIKEAIKDKFLGKIIQMPPVKSRVKRQNRQREIKKFDILEQDEKDILFLAEVQGGTYIRKLVSDLGDYLKIGAHMLELRRIRAGIFKEDTSINLYDFEKAVGKFKKGDDRLLRNMIIPAEIIGDVYAFVEIKPNNLKTILTGKPIYKKDLKKGAKVEKNSIIAVFCKERFIGMYEAIKEKEIFATPKFVMQNLGNYKKINS